MGSSHIGIPGNEAVGRFGGHDGNAWEHACDSAKVSVKAQVGRSRELQADTADRKSNSFQGNCPLAQLVTIVYLQYKTL